MSIAIGLQVRQAQSLAMTPQLLQSIRLLQYDPCDLRDFLGREAEKNPLLRIVERSAAKGVARGAGGVAASSHPRSSAAEERPCGRGSLAAHAVCEIAETFADAGDRALANALLIDFDEVGYLRVEPREAASRLGVSLERIEALLHALRRQAEPAGLFAADLAQCLSLQLERAGRLDPAFQAMLSRLDLVARRDHAALSKVTRREPGDVARMIAVLRRLDPRPGHGFEASAGETIEPDVLITPERGGAWRVALNGRAVPRVLLDEDYERTVQASARTADERAFLAECRLSVSWLARALDQRARSILKVACEIARRQEGFLAEGTRGLKPMTLSSIAQAVGLHESTVSRVTANKYVGTPRGTFELKFFFSGAIASSSGGEAHSASCVRERIRRLVEAERPGAILSDEDIALLLKADGVDLARRTVAKYREALGIASSAQRRREMHLARMAS